MSFQDPKRVHTALREFNDLSANAVFGKIISQIQEIEDQAKSSKISGLQRRGTLAPKSHSENMAGSLGVAKPSMGGATSSMGTINMAAAAGLESLEVDATTADEIINNVEKMINAEKVKDKAAKKDKKADQKTLDLTGGAQVAAPQSSKPVSSSASSSASKADSKKTTPDYSEPKGSSASTAEGSTASTPGAQGRLDQEAEAE